MIFFCLTFTHYLYQIWFFTKFRIKSIIKRNIKFSINFIVRLKLDVKSHKLYLPFLYAKNCVF